MNILKRALLAASLLGSLPLASQKFSFTYDHYSFIVEDLQKTGDFYAYALGLEEIPHPSDTVNFRWFRIRGNTQVHLIRKDQVVKTESKSVHLCLSIRDLDGYIAFLEQEGIPYWDWPGKPNSVTDRADGVRQIYLRDPEDNWVEINTAEHAW
ncbi:MAG TPA: VOC family protein [Robiginitalea sp.]|nr:VOC family protein [Robiginitalea sp.]